MTKSRCILRGLRPEHVAVVRRVNDANGAACRECNALFSICDPAPWGWRKSRLNHERGTGHKMDMVAL